MNRSLGVFLAAGGLGAALALLSSGREWASVSAGGLPPVSLTGGGLAPALNAAAIAAAAGLVAILATRGTARRLVAVLIALCGAAAATASLIGIGRDAIGDAAAAGRGVLAQAGVDGGGTSVALSPWPYLAVAGGVLIAFAGIHAVLRAGTWPGMSARYDRSPSEGPASGAGLWDALDRGADPTVDETRER
ncbi:Trp biosynthesis-associated membrane protein [Rhizohabitans arisaemae]|uniref:Trp biosynthesis-associated membrane protein n=1 Tax=Rhizohabitans arisaemae TaxID=2720610 RepID=UPI0024B21231|nr:Trp biosynthesis-associated membrane protein [Rhizohabitans arisaemae]